MNRLPLSRFSGRLPDDRTQAQLADEQEQRDEYLALTREDEEDDENEPHQAN